MEQKWNDGCTAMVVIRRGDQLFWGHIGDCRAVIGRHMKNGTFRLFRQFRHDMPCFCVKLAMLDVHTGSVKAVALNKEHNCGLPEEAARVKAAGGWFSEEKEWFADRFKLVFGSNPNLQHVVSVGNHWKKLYRLNDEITVSRAIGDYFCKGKENMDKFDWMYPTSGHSRKFSAEFDLVVAVPEVGVYDIPTNFDEVHRVFMILACDGLWDVVSNDLAASFVNLKVQEGSFQHCSKELVKLAIELGSLDNVSVIVVSLASDN
jgi:serine/threonine protein phosphatase PrpC